MKKFERRKLRIFSSDIMIHYSFHQDRKSTRLNSSHANISYAVFCLKKKNRELHSPFQGDGPERAVPAAGLPVAPRPVRRANRPGGRTSQPAAADGRLLGRGTKRGGD